MMDAHEAIRSLDGYCETLGSLGALLGAKIFKEKSPEQEGLLSRLKQQQIDGREIALMIVKEIHTVGTKSDRSGDLAGVNAAVTRYLEADRQADEAIKKVRKVDAPSPSAEAIRRFREKRGVALKPLT